VLEASGQAELMLLWQWAFCFSTVSQSQLTELSGQSDQSSSQKGGITT